MNDLTRYIQGEILGNNHDMAKTTLIFNHGMVEITLNFNHAMVKITLIFNHERSAILILAATKKTRPRPEGPNQKF